MTEITQVVNKYCEIFKQREKLRSENGEVTRSLKEAQDDLKEAMENSDLRIIRSIAAGYDIKLYEKVKKPPSSIKNLKPTLEKHNLDPETIDLIMSDMKSVKQEERTKIIKLVPLSKTNNATVIS
jgi:hypothetical protein